MFTTAGSRIPDVKIMKEKKTSKQLCKNRQSGGKRESEQTDRRWAWWRKRRSDFIWSPKIQKGKHFYISNFHLVSEDDYRNIEAKSWTFQQDVHLLTSGTASATVWDVQILSCVVSFERPAYPHSVLLKQRDPAFQTKPQTNILPVRSTWPRDTSADSGCRAGPRSIPLICFSFGVVVITSDWPLIGLISPLIFSRRSADRMRPCDWRRRVLRRRALFSIVLL